jgi:hypothetical protein
LETAECISLHLEQVEAENWHTGQVRLTGLFVAFSMLQAEQSLHSPSLTERFGKTLPDDWWLRDDFVAIKHGHNSQSGDVSITLGALCWRAGDAKATYWRLLSDFAHSGLISL